MGSAIQPTTQHHVNELTEALVEEFGDRFERGQVESLMQDSVVQLAGQCEVEDFLPILAHRFARERLHALARSRGLGVDIVFVSLSGGGRGQIAAALTTLLAGDSVTVHSAGTATGGIVDPSVAAVIDELGIDMTEAFARPVSTEVLASADIVVTMGLSVGVVETSKGARREDWRVGDPVGASINEARRVRDDVERRVRTLLLELGALAPGAGASAPEHVPISD